MKSFTPSVPEAHRIVHAYLTSSQIMVVVILENVSPFSSSTAGEVCRFNKIYTYHCAIYRHYTMPAQVQCRRQYCSSLLHNVVQGDRAHISAYSTAYISTYIPAYISIYSTAYMYVCFTFIISDTVHARFP